MVSTVFLLFFPVVFSCRFFLDNRGKLCFYAASIHREHTGQARNGGKKLIHKLVLVLLFFCTGLPAA
jgi:hypothetical protein